MKLNYYGQSSFLLEVNGTKILFDPFISPNELAKDIDVEKIECDYILVSHGHQDHIADLITIAKRTNAKVVSSFEIVDWLAKQGVDNAHPMNLGGSWKFDFGKVKMVYAAHSNSLPDGTYAGTAAGFVIEIDGKVIYYAGDTALTQEMKLIGELFNIDYAFFPIGDNFTMGISDAIVASGFVKCKKVIAMHYDTFGYIKVDHQQAIKSFADSDIELSMLKISDQEGDSKIL